MDALRLIIADLRAVEASADLQARPTAHSRSGTLEAGPKPDRGLRPMPSGAVAKAVLVLG